jgi:hypothetical protein
MSCSTCDNTAPSVTVSTQDGRGWWDTAASLHKPREAIGTLTVAPGSVCITGAAWRVVCSRMRLSCGASSRVNQGVTSGVFSSLAGGNTGCFARHACTVLPVTLHIRRPASRISPIFRSSRTRGVMVLIGTESARAISAFV